MHGLLVKIYYFRLRCERSRVQIPVEPSIFFCIFEKHLNYINKSRPKLKVTYKLNILVRNLVYYWTVGIYISQSFVIFILFKDIKRVL